MNECHLFALHFVLKLRINRALDKFKESWNHHQVRTEHGLSPHQLFVAGTLQLQSSGLVAADFFYHVDDRYGVVEEGLSLEHNSGISVPDVAFSLAVEHMGLLMDRVDPLATSDSFGIDLYEQTLEIIDNIVAANPSIYGSQ